MAFKVIPDSLEGYANQLGRAAGDARDGKGYLDQYGHLGGGILIDLVAGAHKSSISVVTATLEKAAGILDTSRTELAGAAGYYRATDVAAAARADAAVPSVCARQDTQLADAWTKNPCPPGFSDSREPTSRLKPVDDVEYSHPLGFLDAISVSNWALEACDAVFGFNPLTRAQDHFVGDWESFAKAGVAIGRVGDAVHDLGYNIYGGAIALNGSWDGSAADAAHAYFTGFANSVAGIKDPLKEIAQQYDRIAHGVWSASEAVGGFIKGLLDAAIVAGIAFAAGTVTAESGVGAVVGYGVAAVEVANMLRLWAQATSAMQSIYGAVQLAAGLIETQIAALNTVNLSALPGGAGYDHPQVNG